MHQEKLRIKEHNRQQVLEEENMRNNTQFKNRESEEMRINRFKKEFRIALAEIQKRRRTLDINENQVDPREHVIDFNHVALIMTELGFLNNKSSNE